MKLLFALLAVIAVSLVRLGPGAAASGRRRTHGAQKPKVSPFAEYAGEWTSTFDGKVWLRLQLELHGDQLTGSLLHAAQARR